MAKIKIQPGYSLKETADELASIGVTLDRHRYPDGTYRAYVRKKNLGMFMQIVSSEK